MEELLSKFVEVSLIAMYLHDSLHETRIWWWGLLVLLMQLSVNLMEPKAQTVALNAKEILCFALYCLYLIGGLIFAFWVPYFWMFLFTFICTSGLVVLRFSPPFILEKSGSGGIFRIILEGSLWVVLHGFAISDSPRIVNIEYMPVFMVFEAWYLVKELTNSPEDIKNKLITTGILMGRHGCFRMFFLLHLFSWIYSLLDMYYGSIMGLPLLISPWAALQISKVRALELTTLQTQAFVYYLCFSLLTAISLFYKF